MPKVKSDLDISKYRINREVNLKKMNITESVKNVYQITEKLAFPRLVGSTGEKEAIKLVVDEFQNAGYNSVYRDTFKTSLHIWIFVRYIFLVLGSGLIVLALSFYISSYLTLGLTVVLFFLSLRVLKVSASTEIKLSKNENYNFDTENIFVKLKSKNSKCKIVFIGHWDSKSQSFPPSVRVIIFLTFIIGTLILYICFFILSLLAIFTDFQLILLPNIMLDSCLIIASVGALNYFNKTGNKSNGAFDNASAVGTIIELAKFYKLNPLDNIDLVFLSTGSEELNLGGAIHFIKKYNGEYEKESSFFINLDLIGGAKVIRLITSYGIPRKNSSIKLNNLFLNTAEELNIKIKDVYSPSGVWSDFMPFVQAGYQACWLGSEPGLKYVHTENDNLSLVSKEGIKNILLLCMKVVEKLDSEFQ